MVAKKTAFLAASIALIAFVLRVARLDYISLRGDESFSVMVASWDRGRLFDLLAATEPHPPLYYTALHFWMRIAGDSEFSVRFLSAAFGVLLVPATFALGIALAGRLGGTPVGKKATGPNAKGDHRYAAAALVAALLVAVNPFLVWHSQDARSYSLLALLTTASILLSLGALSERRRWGGYVVVTYAAILTHYAAFYVVAMENFGAVLLLLLWREDRLARARRWLSAQAILILAYLLWVWWAIRPLSSHSGDWMLPVDAAVFLERTLVALGVGITVDPESRPAVLLAVVLVLILAMIGFLRAGTGGERKAFGAAVFCLVSPALLLFVFSLWRPMFDERHLVIIVSAFALVVSLGAARLSVWPWPGLAVISVLVGSLAILSLASYFFDPAYSKSPGWRALAGEIRKDARGGDYILLNFPDPTFHYYYRGPNPVGILPSQMPLDRADLEQSLANLARSYRRIWAVPSPSPNWDADSFVEKWLMAHLHKVKEARFDGVKLVLFSVE